MPKRGGPYDWRSPSKRSARALRTAINYGRLAAHRQRFLRIMVLALATRVRLPRRDERNPAMAVVRGRAISFGIRHRSALRLGLRLDRARHSGTVHSSATSRGGWLLSIRQKSNVRWFCRGMDWAVDRFRAGQH